MTSLIMLVTMTCLYLLLTHMVKPWLRLMKEIGPDAIVGSPTASIVEVSSDYKLIVFIRLVESLHVYLVKYCCCYRRCSNKGEAARYPCRDT